MFEKLAHIVLPSFLLLAFGISAATETPAARSETAPAEISYLCQLADGRSVRTSLPQGRCRPVTKSLVEEEADLPKQAAAVSPPVVAASASASQPADKANGGSSELPAIWQEAVAAASDVEISKSVPMRVTLRHQPERRAPVHPAPVIAAAKPLTPKEIIARDIRREERALAQVERELATARRNNQSDRAGNLQLQIADRRSGLQSLRQELRRHQ
ncbi:hypothetical protein A7Q01_04180 [Eikenella sp. NML96-A-049]|uniref:hypothetical protein n=1 Tax=unclassified Eikenella TaxID=2639367 RepID=UPI0007E2571C|nr:MULTISPECIES: hypothetical protein [unclassified Eikenella]OAM33407.1 hypothetical protein A7P97_08405 [Eikenella sp. NML070372]OAM40329.1 hypothetical protein A7Q01_04180 [Eikenella sp. NML96-A-049]VDG99230.1 Uncharacterised protein [Helicobacter pametensis]